MVYDYLSLVDFLIDKRYKLTVVSGVSIIRIMKTFFCDDY